MLLVALLLVLLVALLIVLLLVLLLALLLALLIALLIALSLCKARKGKRQKLMDGFKNVNLNDVTASIVEKYFFFV